MKDDRMIRLVTVILAGLAGYTFSNGLHTHTIGSIVTGMLLFVGAALVSYYVKV